MAGPRYAIALSTTACGGGSAGDEQGDATGPTTTRGGARSRAYELGAPLPIYGPRR